jgi:hypothetical protein
MARPTNASKEGDLKLKEECQQIEKILNALEQICKTSSIEQKEDLSSTIGYYIGKLSVRYQNLVSMLNVDWGE